MLLVVLQRLWRNSSPMNHLLVFSISIKACYMLPPPSSLSETGRQGWSWLFPSPVLNLHLTRLWYIVTLLSPKGHVSQAPPPCDVLPHQLWTWPWGLCWPMSHQQVWSKQRLDKHLCIDTGSLGAQLPRKQVCALLLERWCGGESRCGRPDWPPDLSMRPSGKSQLPANLLSDCSCLSIPKQDH